MNIHSNINDLNIAEYEGMLDIMGSQDVLPSDLIDALKNNKILPIVAAGVSMSVTDGNDNQIFPSWLALLEKAAEKLDESDAESKKLAAGITAMLNLGNYQMAADLARKGLNGQPWFQFFGDQFKKDLSSANLDLAKAIWKISNSIITLNYDKVMERSCPDVNVSVYDNNSRAEICRFTEGDSQLPELWHLHGQIDNIGDVIFTSESYENLYKQSPGVSDKYQAAISRLKSLSSTKQFLFIGCSMDDVDLLGKLAEQDEIFANGTGPHFVLAKESDIPLLNEKLKASGVSFKYIPFKEFGQPLFDEINRLGSYCHSHVDPVVSIESKPQEVVGNEKTQIALLFPQPLDNYLNFSESLKEFKKLKADVHYYPLSLQRLNDLDGMDYIIILSSEKNGKFIIEDEYYCQEHVAIEEIVNNIGNVDSKGVFLFCNSLIDREILVGITEPIMIIPKLDKKVLVLLIFRFLINIKKPLSLLAILKSVIRQGFG